MRGMLLLLMVEILASRAYADNLPIKILVNQAGYMSSWPKQALIQSPPANVDHVDLVDAASNTVIKSLPMTAPQIDIHSGYAVARVSFDSVGTGRYRLQLADTASSVFSINDRPYDQLMVKLLRSYYLQRCGLALNDQQSGLHHAADHQHDALLRHSDAVNLQNTAIASTGGWHDAGDYGKYVATTTVAIAELLTAYERRPQAYADKQLDIPESGNQQSDLLDEVQVGLTWLLTMQRQDGAVYRKLSGLSWPTAISPDVDNQPRYIFGVSSPETAKFAGVMAQAARIFRRSAPSQAEQYRQASISAWRWLKKTPNQYIDWHEGDDSGSGKYLHSKTDQEASLLTDQDDRLWAAAQLWLLTHQPQYLTYLQHADFSLAFNLFEWKNPAFLAVIALLETPSGQKLPAPLLKRLRQGVLAAANQSLQRSQASQYQLANHRFVWGSNKMAAEEGRILLMAYHLSGDKQFWQAAQAQLNYILGVNPQGISFVTGIGEQRVNHVAHLFARAAKQNIEGLLVGGANNLAQDRIAPKGLGILSYVDDERAYSVNEYAIDYNSALIGLLSALYQYHSDLVLINKKS